MLDHRLNAEEVRAFIYGRGLKCFDGETKQLAALIEYHTDGTCHAKMANGDTDVGRYGFEDDLYWTQYKWFRKGDLYRFYLVRMDQTSCQAFFEDGTKALLQTILKAAV